MDSYQNHRTCLVGVEGFEVLLTLYFSYYTLCVIGGKYIMTKILLHEATNYEMKLLQIGLDNG